MDDMDGALTEMQEKKREAAQGLGPGGVHVLKEEEEKNGIFAGNGTNGFLAETGNTRMRCGVGDSIN